MRSYHRRPEDQRWNQEEFNQVQGVPWQPILGKGGVDVKSSYQVKDDEEPIAPIKTREALPRRIDIRRGDVADEKYVVTPGCKGCAAANRGSTGIYNEHCRKRIEPDIAKKEPNRYNKVTEKLSKHDSAGRYADTGEVRGELRD